MIDISYKRHLAKTVTWRVVATIETIILSWIISGDSLTGLKIGLAEVATKMILYFFHERAWFKINLAENGVILDSRKRHVAKTLTWRLIGTIDTILLAWLISGNSLIGFKIGVVEFITKILLYYLHERSWYKINYGLYERKKR